MILSRYNNFVIFSILKTGELRNAIKQYGIRILILLFIIPYCGPGYCQIYDKFQSLNTDSIKHVISESDGVNKIQHYFNLVDAYLITDPDSCLKYAEVAKELTKESGDQELIADAEIYMGKACYFNGSYEESIQHYLKAYDYYLESKNFAKV